MLFRSLLTIFLFLLVSEIVYGQKEGKHLEKREVLQLPGKYNFPTTGDDFQVDYSPASETLKMRWVVYSDRADNHTYKSPGGSSLHSTLSYLDEFFVVEE
ncbi:MAG: hypothetical protein KDH98_08575, partial [Calditrichaeota bacterium]|nr:hypothetical protein [Calditrichota bacterium]